jgi:hypothetical protein
MPTPLLQVWEREIDVVILGVQMKVRRKEGIPPPSRLMWFNFALLHRYDALYLGYKSSLF